MTSEQLEGSNPPIELLELVAIAESRWDVESPISLRYKVEHGRYLTAYELLHPESTGDEWDLGWTARKGP